MSSLLSSQVTTQERAESWERGFGARGKREGRARRKGASETSSMKRTGIFKPQLTGMTVHQGLASSQTLHFLFRDRRARVWKWKPRGIYWPQAQGVEIKKEKRLWIGYSRVYPCIFIGTHLYRWVGPPFFLLIPPPPRPNFISSCQHLCS